MNRMYRDTLFYVTSIHPWSNIQQVLLLQGFCAATAFDGPVCYYDGRLMSKRIC
jgi:hypothetical protein